MAEGWLDERSGTRGNYEAGYIDVPFYDGLSMQRRRENLVTAPVISMNMRRLCEQRRQMEVMHVRCVMRNTRLQYRSD